MIDRGTEFGGAHDQHEYELYLAVENIDHTRTKTRGPQINGIVERYCLDQPARRGSLIAQTMLLGNTAPTPRGGTRSAT